jgi:hypothetical protein
MQGHLDFGDAELAFAASVVSSAHAIVWDLGMNSERVSFGELGRLQSFILESDFHVSAICWSVVAHSDGRSTISCSINFLASLDCACGAEILRELMFLNGGPSVALFLKTFREIIFRIFECHSACLPDAFMGAIAPFAPRLGKAMEAIQRRPTADVAYLHFVSFFLMRLSFEPLDNLSTFVFENYHAIQNHIRAIVRLTAIEADLGNAARNQFSLSIIGRMYEQINRFHIRVFSPTFLRDTATLLTYFVHVPVVTECPLIYDLQRAYDAISLTVRTAPGFSIFPRVLLHSDLIGAAIIGSLIPFDLTTILAITESLLESSARRVFLIALRLCISSISIDGFVAKMSDLFFTIMVAEEERLSRVTRLANYQFLMAELFLASVDFAREFVQTIGFRELRTFHQQAMLQTPEEMISKKKRVLDAFLYFETQLFRVVPDPERSPPPLARLFTSTDSLRTRTIDLLFDCAVAVSLALGKVPYVLRSAHADRLVALEAEALDSTKEIIRPLDGSLPWTDWDVGSLEFFPVLPSAVTYKPEFVPAAQRIFVVDGSSHE